MSADQYLVYALPGLYCCTAFFLQFGVICLTERGLQWVIIFIIDLSLNICLTEQISCLAYEMSRDRVRLFHSVCKLLVLSNHQSKTKRYFNYNDRKQRKTNWQQQKIKQATLTFERLEPENVWPFCLINRLRSDETNGFLCMFRIDVYCPKIGEPYI